jgi:hypothetical protein
LFEVAGQQSFGPEPWRPTVDEYLECRHSQRGLSRTHVGPAAAASFDAEAARALDELTEAGVDRIYLNAYVPNLQVAGQLVTFFTQHRAQPIPSPVLFAQMGNAFRAAVTAFAEEHTIPVIYFAKDDRRIAIIRPYFEHANEPGVVAIGVAQELQSVFTAYDRSKLKRGQRRPTAHYAFVKEDRRSPFTTSTLPTRTSGWGSSRSVRISRIRPRCGSTATRGPNAEPGGHQAALVADPGSG